MKKNKENLNKKRVIFLFTVLALSVIIQSGCGMLELKSSWKEMNIEIDGNYDDWLGSLFYFEDEKISLGLLNDGSDLYICMITEDRFIRPQMMGQGFTVWFDPEGGKKKVFGIRFPTGRTERGEDDFRAGMGRMMPGQRMDEEMMERTGQFLDQVVIIETRDELEQEFAVDELGGIEIFLDVTGGISVYELKVPLQSDEAHPYAIRVNTGDVIGLGLEIPKMDMNAMQGRVGGLRDRGGMGRPGGMGGGMDGRSGMRPRMPRGLNVWANVQLAVNGDSRYE